ncbi:hypothetical protein [Actinoplanes sp. RD1]|uniref:hypothetical protein n=1 Tax=Actinoplanes sp. RD1 TaxID=3064538 RepID=UPI0027421B15|nr:hypothetical protein [Actinoplanes sp. RD1]
MTEISDPTQASGSDGRPLTVAAALRAGGPVDESAVDETGSMVAYEPVVLVEASAAGG